MTTPPKRPSNRRRLAILAACVAAVPLIAELGLRWLLFGHGEVPQRLGANLRHAERYASFHHDEAYWRLLGRFDPELAALLERACVLEPELGWGGASLVAGTDRHRYEQFLGSRRPVLLFGASFATEHYSTLLDATELGATHGLLTYGVGGYGVGQASLLARRVLPRFSGRDPLVLLGICVDSDLSRARLGLREAAKPRFALDADGRPLREPFEPRSLRADVEAHPAGVASYLLAWLGGRQSPVPPLRAVAERRCARECAADVQLNLALLADLRDAVERAGGEFAVVLFHSPATLYPPPGPLELALLAGLEVRELAYLDSRRLFTAARSADRRLADLFHGPDHPSAGHPNDAGRAVLLELFRAALGGHRDGIDADRDPYADRFPR